MFRGAKAKLLHSKRACFALQNTVFYDPKHISFAIKRSSLILHLSSLFLKDICFTRLKRKKIPTDIVKFFSRDLTFFYNHDHEPTVADAYADATVKSVAKRGK